MTSDLENSTTRSGKYYRTNQEGDRSIYSPVRESSSQSRPTTPLSNQHRGKNSPTPLPPPEDDMAMHMNLPTFNIVGDEDMDQFWFVIESVCLHKM